MPIQLLTGSLLCVIYVQTRLVNTIIFSVYSIHKSKLKVKENCIEVISSGIIIVRPPPSNKSSLYHVLQNLKEQLPKVVIKV